MGNASSESDTFTGDLKMEKGVNHSLAFTKKTFLSGLSLRVLVVSMLGVLIAVTLALAGRLDRDNPQEHLAFLVVGLILILTGLAAVVFFLRLSVLRAILRRLDTLLEKYFCDGSKSRLIPGGDECARIDFALRLLEENMSTYARNERILRQHERISASILKALHQSVIVADSQGMILQFSQGAERMLGYSSDEMIGRQTPVFFHDPNEIRRRAEELTEELGIPVAPAFPALIAKAQLTGQTDEREWTYVRKDGVRLTVLLSIAVFDDDQGNSLSCWMAMDITERSRLAAKILRLANYDPLTQLPNRRLFHDRIRTAITQARRKNTNFGLLMIDLDRFKLVNDRYGHLVGDILLGAVAGRMQKCLRESDTLARVGGDEFVVILQVLENARDTAGVARKIRQSLCLPFDLTDDITVDIDCSIGVAVYPDHGSDEDSLLKSADDAMYLAKGLGGGRSLVAGESGEAAAGSKGTARQGDAESFA